MTTSPDESFDVFISHSHADAGFAVKLSEQLEAEEIAENGVARKVRVFLDQWDIKLGENIPLRLIGALERARYVACLLSPEFLTSDWASFEFTSVLAVDPLNRRGKLVGLRVRDVSLDQSTTLTLRTPFHMNNWLDFRRETDFAAGIQKLVGYVRGESIPRGVKRSPLAGPALVQRGRMSKDAVGTAPDLKTETLISNLLPITTLPAVIWTAATTYRSFKDIPKEAWPLPPFILRDEQLITFCPIGGSALANVCDQKAASSASLSLKRGDAKVERWTTELIGRCVRVFLPERKLMMMGPDRYIFKVGDDGKDVVITSGKHQKRRVSKQATNHKDGSIFWVHQAAYISIVRIGDDFFLEIDPTYCFSHDGRMAIKGKSATRLSIQWLGKQQNVQLLRDLVFWANWLGGGKLEFPIPTGGEPLLVAASPAQAETRVGLQGDDVKISALVDQGTFTVDQVAAQVGEAEDDEPEGESEDDHET